jgi:hypothetical protein
VAYCENAYAKGFIKGSKEPTPVHGPLRITYHSNMKATVPAGLDEASIPTLSPIPKFLFKTEC